MTDEPGFTVGGLAPTTALMAGVLAVAAKVVIVEASPDELDRADAARIAVSEDAIGQLARLLAVVDGGTGDHCLCMGWPTILVLDASGAEIARWTLHHQTGIRGLGNCDAELRDAPGLTDWLADRGLTGSRKVQQQLSKVRAAEEERRLRWVQAAPEDYFSQAAEAASQREDDAEEKLADLVTARYPDATERILTLLTWAGFPPRQMSTYDGETFVYGGTPWHELAPQRMLLTEPTETIMSVLTSQPLTATQLDGAAELLTSLEWTRPLRAEVPEPLRSILISHVTTTGTDPMRFRMHHGYGAPPIT
ncbi:hypothetical protein [Catelliglobosispora koreensis]|uniref:hypothetical protein n=1 Tax=Catelliglobosispora koreensis TaxID=129052 RepID=UPI000365B40B|nr:hypothetical protein [Catelliglobosispora koreensis]